MCRCVVPCRQWPRTNTGGGSDVEVSAGDLLAAGIADDGEYTIAIQVEGGIVLDVSRMESLAGSIKSN